MSDANLQTEFEFTLPKGYVDEEGNVHREGRMRLATAADEIKPLNDPRVQENSSYLTIILLSRVVTRLGTVEEVTPEVIESLFVPDLEFLQELYERANDGSTDFADLDGIEATGSPMAADESESEREVGTDADDAETDNADAEPGNV